MTKDKKPAEKLDTGLIHWPTFIEPTVEVDLPAGHFVQAACPSRGL